jgi:hypothetical protein
MNNNEVTLETLARTWLDAKEDERNAIQKRRAIDAEIAARLAGPDEGSASEKFGNIKVFVTRKLTRKVDTTKLQEAWASMPEKVQKAFKWDAEIVTKHFRALQELGASELEQVQQFITTKPAAPSVDVELITQE